MMTEGVVVNDGDLITFYNEDIGTAEKFHEI
jgi:hypothetical protein